MGQGATAGMQGQATPAATGSGPSQPVGTLPDMRTGQGAPPVFSPTPTMQNMQGSMGGAGGKGGPAAGGTGMPPTSVGGLTGGQNWTGMK